MNLYELIECCQAIAIKNLLLPSENSTWRAFSRAYSKRFSVPLSEVRKMNPEEVISEIIEDNYDQTDAVENVEYLLEQIYVMEGGEKYQKQKEVDMDAFIKIAAKTEKGRITKEENIQKARLEKLVPTKNKGGVDFSNLNEKNEK